MGAEGPGEGRGPGKLTADREARSALCVACVAGVVAGILLLSTVHQQLSGCALQHHLVLGTGEELQGALAPLHAGACPAQLTAQVCRCALVYLLGLQLPKEPHGCNYRGEGECEGRCRSSYGGRGAQRRAAKVEG